MYNIKNIKISASILKIIALITMLIDHIGMLLFPDTEIFRIIGRIAFPLYAFLIGEGCKYTKNKWKYLRNMFFTFISFQIISYIINKKFKLCVLFGFALFILFTIILDWSKKNWNKRFIIPELFAIFSCILLFILDCEYLFFTFLLPLISYIFKNKNIKIFIFFYNIINSWFLL